MNFIKFFFPKFPKSSQSKRGADKDTRDKIVSSLQFGGSLDYLFEEIKKIELMQEGRTKVAEKKASFYLIFSGALLPVFTFLISERYDVFHNLVLALATIYLLIATHYLFGTLSVKGYNKIYISDIFKLSDKRGKTKEDLAKKYLENLLKDEQLRNEKFDHLDMAQKYLQRTFFALGAIILVQIFRVWEIARPLFAWLMLFWQESKI